MVDVDRMAAGALDARRRARLRAVRADQAAACGGDRPSARRSIHRCFRFVVAGAGRF